MSKIEEKTLETAILACARAEEGGNDVDSASLQALREFIHSLLASYLCRAGRLTKWLFERGYRYDQIDKWVFLRDENDVEITPRIARWSDQLTAAILRRKTEFCGCWATTYSDRAEKEAHARCCGNDKKRAAHHLTIDNIRGQANPKFQCPKDYVQKAILGDFYFAVQKESTKSEEESESSRGAIPENLANSFGYSMFRAIFETPNANPVVLGRIQEVVIAEAIMETVGPLKHALVEVNTEGIHVNHDGTKKWLVLSKVPPENAENKIARTVMVCKTCSYNNDRVYIVNQNQDVCLDAANGHEVYKMTDKELVVKGYEFTDLKQTKPRKLKKTKPKKRLGHCPNGHFWIVKGKQNKLMRCPVADCRKYIASEKTTSPIIYHEVTQ